MAEVILCSCGKKTNEIQRKNNNEFNLSICELEPFIALQYARGLCGKNHPLHFFYSETYGIPIFLEKMSHG